MAFFVTNKFINKTSWMFWIALGLFIILVSSGKVLDIDIWWHMQCGRSMIENFTLPDFSDYYFTPVNGDATGSLRYTWLGDIIFYLLHTLSGDIGLQLFRLVIIILSCVIIRLSAGKNYKGWHLLLLMLLVIGTYQKQLIRNSLFVFFLFPLIFWIWYQIKYKNKAWMIWLYPVILSLWSCLHGSYLLGFALTLLILLGEVIDSTIDRFILKKKSGQNLLKKVGIYSIVILISFVLISAWNPTTGKFFNLSRVTGFFEKTEIPQDSTALTSHPSTSKELSITRNDFDYSVKDPSFPTRIKLFLNNTIFKRSSDRGQSGDFVSPFDKLDRLYVWAAFLSGLIGAAALAFLIRPVRFSDVLPFVAILILGAGYIRTVGYIPLIVSVILLKASGEKDFCGQSLPDKYMWGTALLVLLLMITNIVLSSPVKIGTKLSEFGLGRVPRFSESCADKIITDHKQDKVFTTMSNGGYLLYRWYPEKKVFVDGFFAPHPDKVMLHRDLLWLDDTDADYLNEEYGVSMALVEHTSNRVLNTFFKSENWYVKYVDKGMVCFEYEPDFDSDIALPEILFGAKHYNALPPFYKQALANSFYTILNSFYRKGRVKDGNVFKNSNMLLINMIKKSVDINFVRVTEKIGDIGKQAYGDINSKTLYYELQYLEAIEEGDGAKIINTGLKLIEKEPGKLTITLNIEGTLAANGEFKKSVEVLQSLLTKRQEIDYKFSKQEKTNLAKLLLNQSQYYKNKRKYLKSYELMERGDVWDGELVSNAEFYQAALQLVAALNKNNQKNQGLSILERMEKRFFKTGAWLNDMAWQLLITQNIYPNRLVQAETYAKEAITKMEKNDNPMLDMSYDTLAQIFFAKKNFSQGCKYIEMAFKAAPDSRKSIYKYPKECTAQ